MDRFSTISTAPPAAAGTSARGRVRTDRSDRRSFRAPDLCRTCSDRRIGFLLLFCLIVSLLPGCGGAEYDQRLAQTAAYFRYLEKLDANLDPAWKEQGVQLRVPVEYRLIPAPPRPKQEKPTEGEEAVEPPKVPDPRQPDFAGRTGVEIPGLLGAWEGEVSVDESEEDVPVWMYVVSNHDAWLDEGQEAATHFVEEATGKICQALGVYPPRPESNAWAVERYPKTKSYVAERPYLAVTIEREEPYRPHGERLENVKYMVKLFWYQTPSEDIKVGVVFVIPEHIRQPPQKTGLEVPLNERLEIALETLQVVDQRPDRRGKGGGGAPAGF